MYKKAQSPLKGYIIALLVFSLVIVSFVTVPNSFDDAGGNVGFWNIYGYSVPANNITGVSQLDPTQQLIKDISCDIVPEQEACGQTQTNPVALVSSFISIMVQNGFGALVTIIKSIGYGSDAIWAIGLDLGIPPVVLQVLVSMLFLTIILAILFLIFNRSDSG